MDPTTDSGMDQIVKFLRDAPPAIGIHLSNIINHLVKLNTFPSKCKITKVKSFLKKGTKELRLKLKLWTCYKKGNRKSVHDKKENYQKK